MDKSSLIEAILFVRGDPISEKELAHILSESEDIIRGAIDVLRTQLTGRGIRLIEKDGNLTLGTAPETSMVIEKMRSDEFSRDLGKAATETLAIICYHGPVAKYAIDHIRGVNSVAILRSLMIRGLIERTANPDDERSFLYRPSFELMAYLGITNINELPGIEVARGQIQAFLDGEQTEDANQDGH